VCSIAGGEDGDEDAPRAPRGGHGVGEGVDCAAVDAAPGGQDFPASFLAPTNFAGYTLVTFLTDHITGTTTQSIQHHDVIIRYVSHLAIQLLITHHLFPIWAPFR